MESSGARARHWEPEPGNFQLGQRHAGLLRQAISDGGMLPRAVVGPPSLDVSESGLGARLGVNQVTGLGLGMCVVERQWARGLEEMV